MLYETLTRQIPNYDWQKTVGENRGEGYDTIYAHRPTEPLTYKRRGFQQMKGRGKVDVSLRHRPFYMPVVRRWFNRLRWKPREGGPNTLGTSVTLLECVWWNLSLILDSVWERSEVKTLAGVKRPKGWLHFLNALVRTHTIRWNCVHVTFKQVVRPIADATSTTPLRGPLMSGFGRRPEWADTRTP